MNDDRAEYVIAYAIVALVVFLMGVFLTALVWWIS